MQIGAEAVLSARDTYILVDCRSVEEQAVSKLDGAISQKDFDAELKEKGAAAVVGRGMVVAPYCTIGYRSGIYARQLKKDHGIDAVNQEGVLLWTHEGNGMMVDAKDGVTATQNVHVYGQAWAYAAPGWHMITFPKPFLKYMADTVKGWLGW